MHTGLEGGLAIGCGQLHVGQARVELAQAVGHVIERGRIGALVELVLDLAHRGVVLPSTERDCGPRLSAAALVKSGALRVAAARCWVSA